MFDEMDEDEDEDETMADVRVHVFDSVVLLLLLLLPPPSSLPSALLACLSSLPILAAVLYLPARAIPRDATQNMLGFFCAGELGGGGLVL